MSTRHGKKFEFTGKTLLSLTSIITLIASGIYWWGIQSLLTQNKVVAGSLTLLMTLAPPALISFLIPWSPAGMLLLKINGRTWGYWICGGSSIFLVGYSIHFHKLWWSAQPVTANSGLVWLQVFVGLIGFVLIPALLWAPVGSTELVEQIRQAHLVRRYELQTQADLAILRNTLLRAQEKALIGFDNLSPQERQELAAVMKGLVQGIDTTIEDLARSVRDVCNVTLPCPSLTKDPNIAAAVETIQQAIESSAQPTQQPKTREESRRLPEDSRHRMSFNPTPLEAKKANVGANGTEED